MIEIDGVYYMLNLQKINEYLFQSQREKNNENEIIETYETIDGVSRLKEKTIREIKNSGNVNIDALKYDLFKEMLSILLNFNSLVNLDQDVDAYDEDSALSLANMALDGSFGEKVIYNTFINQGFLVAVPSDKNDSEE